MQDQEVQSIGRDIMQADHSGNPKVHGFKLMFAELFDKIAQEVVLAEKENNTNPTIISEASIKKHMDTIKSNEEMMRCLSEAGKYLELACMWTTKGLTA